MQLTLSGNLIFTYLSYIHDSTQYFIFRPFHAFGIINEYVAVRFSKDLETVHGVWTCTTSRPVQFLLLNEDKVYLFAEIEGMEPLFVVDLALHDQEGFRNDVCVILAKEEAISRRIETVRLTAEPHELTQNYTGNWGTQRHVLQVCPIADSSWLAVCLRPYNHHARVSLCSVHASTVCNGDSDPKIVSFTSKEITTISTESSHVLAVTVHQYLIETPIVLIFSLSKDIDTYMVQLDDTNPMKAKVSKVRTTGSPKCTESVDMCLHAILMGTKVYFPLINYVAVLDLENWQWSTTYWPPMQQLYCGVQSLDNNGKWIVIPTQECPTRLMRIEQLVAAQDGELEETEYIFTVPPLTVPHEQYKEQMRGMIDNPDSYPDMTFTFESSDEDEHPAHILAHRSILLTRCEYFRSLFTSKFKEAQLQENIIHMENTSREAFLLLLRHLYYPYEQRDIDSLSLQQTMELYIVCDRLNVRDICTCIEELVKHLDDDGLCSVFEFAHHCGLQQIKTICKEQLQRKCSLYADAGQIATKVWRVLSKRPVRER